MKPITKKILESGFLDKHVTAMFERWGTLDLQDKSPETTLKIRTKEQLEKFAEELEELMDQESDVMRETPLDLPVSPEESFVLPNNGKCFSARWDAMGRLVVENGEVALKRGEQINSISPGGFFRVLDVMTIYKGEEAYARLVTVEDW